MVEIGAYFDLVFRLVNGIWNNFPFPKVSELLWMGEARNFYLEVDGVNTVLCTKKLMSSQSWREFSSLATHEGHLGHFISSRGPGCTPDQEIRIPEYGTLSSLPLKFLGCAQWVSKDKSPILESGRHLRE